ncbi:hypothetical protein TMatcc_002234 [Talaromyces marneffei ATCC 18224]
MELDRALSGPTFADTEIARSDNNKFLSLRRVNSGPRDSGLTKVTGNLLLLFKANISKFLVTEHQATALSAQQSHFIESFRGTS